MKNIILILLVITFYNCKAQTIYPLGTPPEDRGSDNYYLKDTQNTHDLVVGTWRWESETSSFELTLQEFEMNPIREGANIFWDDIFGKYKYVENGVTISEINEITGVPNFKVKVFHKENNTFDIAIKDIISKKSKVGDFVINPDGTATMTLVDYPHNGIQVIDPDNPPTNLDFQLPTNITLTKVE